MTLRDVTLTVNGKTRTVHVEDRKLLLDTIREDLGLTGAHAGCEHGVCGACTVLVNGQPVRSCLIFAAQAEGDRIDTIESLGQNGNLHPLQEAFVDHYASQCGYCTPGMVLTSYALLQENPNPDEQAVREYLSGNICRCTGYQAIVDAVIDAAGRVGSEAS